MTKFNWNADTTAKLQELVAGDTFVSQDKLATIAEELGTTTRSVGAKLRKMDFEVEKAGTKPSLWSEDQEAQLVEMLNANPKTLTYAELSAAFDNGSFTAKQLQGKVLSLELTDLVRKAEKKVTPKTYTDAEEAKFIEMVNAGSSVEDLSEAFSRTVASVRGKALSLLRAEVIDAMPKQAESTAKEKSDVLAGLDVASMSVQDLVEATGRTERGIKATLSRRGVSCADYDGAARRAKLDAAE